MNIDLDKLNDLPSRGKVSWTYALMATGNGGEGYIDYDLSNKAHNTRRNTKSKNAKAKHRKKFSRWMVLRV